MVVGPILKSRAFASSDSAESSELPLKTNGMQLESCSRLLLQDNIGDAGARHRGLRCCF